MAAKFMLAVGRRPWFFPRCMPPQRCLGVLGRRGGWFPERVIRRTRGHPDASMYSSQSSQAPCIYGHMGQPTAEGTTRMRGKDHRAVLDALPHQIDALSPFAPCLGQNKVKPRVWSAVKKVVACLLVLIIFTEITAHILFFPCMVRALYFTLCHR